MNSLYGQLPDAIYLKKAPWWHGLWMVLGARVTLQNRWKMRPGYIIALGAQWSTHDDYCKYDQWNIQFSLLNFDLQIRRREPRSVKIRMKERI